MGKSDRVDPHLTVDDELKRERTPVGSHFVGFSKIDMGWLRC
jgi:hypothetical protein